MENLPLTIQTPGKLMIAGEFAVLEPYNKLIAMAINKYVYATLEEDSAYTISLDNFGLSRVSWHYEDGHVQVETNDSRMRYTANALEVVCQYLKEQGISLQPIHLRLLSHLDDASGNKYGLGSSAAIVTSVVSAMLKAFLPDPPETELIFKLAAYTHVSTQGNGSGADVAASAYGGFIEYTSFQADWLLDTADRAASLTELVNMSWTYLSIQPFHLPDGIHMTIGWTGEPATTGKLVDRILALRCENPGAYHTFLNESQTAVNQFIQGAQTNHNTLLQSGVEKNRQALSQIGHDAGVDIETEQLRVLCDIAKKYGGVGKSSGAGGGDCGLAFMNTQEAVNEVNKAWETSGIEVLPLEMAPYGAVIIR